MTDVVMFSAGAGSWAAAKRVAGQKGTAGLRLLFTDTLIEDEDTYRFLIEGAANVYGIEVPRQFIPALDSFPPVNEPVARALFLRGLAGDAVDLIPGLAWIMDGRDPWQIFRDERMLGNSRIDPCSKILKRRLADRWLRENCDPAATTVHVGIDWTEEHRFDDGEGGGLRPRRAADGWTYEAAMCEAPYLTKPDMLRLLRAEGIEQPRLYTWGFPHNNCGGFCVKAGQAQAALLLRVLPERYAYHEAQEQEFIRFIGKEVSMMTDRRGDNIKKPLTMKALRERIEAGGQIDMFEWGGCGCFIDDAEAA